MKTKITENSGKERLLNGNIILLERRIKSLQARIKVERWRQVIWFFAGGAVSSLVIMILRLFFK